jgi:crossover junction endodeoxyribonuclease RusA
MIIRLPWYPRELSPNERVHWAVKANATARYRKECGWLAKSQGVLPTEKEIVKMTMVFFPKKRGRQPDKDNMIAATKALRDGLQDALTMDDSRFVVEYAVGEKTTGGAITVEFHE